jgi:hypothetical protein
MGLHGTDRHGLFSGERRTDSSLNRTEARHGTDTGSATVRFTITNRSETNWTVRFISKRELFNGGWRGEATDVGDGENSVFVGEQRILMSWRGRECIRVSFQTWSSYDSSLFPWGRCHWIHIDLHYHYFAFLLPKIPFSMFVYAFYVYFTTTDTVL